MPTSTFLQTRVARRTLTLFMACSLLPVIALAVIGYTRVSTQLREQARARLREASKATGMAMIETLHLSDAVLTNLAEKLRDHERTALSDGAKEGLAMRFSAITMVAPRRTVLLLGDSGITPPALSDNQRAQILAGLSVLMTADQGRSILLGRAIDPSGPDLGLLWARLQPAYLWGSLRRTLAEETGLCVFASVPPTPLFCSQPGPRPNWGTASPQNNSVDAGANWNSENDQSVSGYWSAFLAFEFASPGWTVAVAESRANVYAALAGFRRTFLLVVLLALLVVFLLANIQIRRSTEPLVRLHEATRRIAEREFDVPVLVKSGDEFEALAASFNAMSTRLGRQFTTLQAMNDIDHTALSSPAADRVMDTVLDRFRVVAECDAVEIMLPGPEPAAPWRVVHLQHGTQVSREVRLPLSEQDELLEHPRLLLMNPADRRSYLDARCRIWLVLPLLDQRQGAGAILVGYPDYSHTGDEALARARALADQAAVALSNSRLLERLDQLSWGTITALARTIDAASPWTAGHSERVTKVGLAIGRELNLPGDQLDVLQRGGLLHDIGKIGVPVSILDKPGKLTSDEIQIVQQHPTIGARILAPIAPLGNAVPIVLHHHERYDGTGYPAGLAGEAIPFLARVLAVADVYDALVSDRPYRPGWSHAGALDHIAQEAGTHHDPRVVQAFLRLMNHRDPETLALLRPSERGRFASSNFEQVA